jgi:hypothetical protein
MIRRKAAALVAGELVRGRRTAASDLARFDGAMTSYSAKNDILPIANDLMQERAPEKLSSGVELEILAGAGEVDWFALAHQR